jgi:uncharacterized protein YecE (DUF72 family)
MEFGQIPAGELTKVDFTLPPDSAATPAVLNAAAHDAGGVAGKLYMGGTSWGRAEWVGSLYPTGTKPAQFLDYYVTQFNSIELNATHYQIYGPHKISEWAHKAGGKDFKFCPKVLQLISHKSGFVDAGELTDTFLQGIREFGEHLGPLFLQLPESFKPVQRQPLFQYLQSLPTDMRFFLEIRHPSWFADSTIRGELFNTLRRLNTGAVITDSPGRRDAVHMALPIPYSFVRFVASGNDAIDIRRINDWAARLEQWFSMGLQEAYFFLHASEETKFPALANMVAERFNQLPAVQLPVPPAGLFKM